MRMKQVGNKADIMAVVIRNSEATASIPLGTPVVMAVPTGLATDGLDVVLPATATDVTQSSLGVGVALKAIAAGEYGEAQVFGLCQQVKILRTRGASTDAFASIISGLLLKAESVSNCFATVASNGASAFMPVAVLASTIASIASTAASTQTATTGFGKAFLRMM